MQKTQRDPLNLFLQLGFQHPHFVLWLKSVEDYINSHWELPPTTAEVPQSFHAVNFNFPSREWIAAKRNGAQNILSQMQNFLKLKRPYAWPSAMCTTSTRAMAQRAAYKRSALACPSGIWKGLHYLSRQKSLANLLIFYPEKNPCLVAYRQSQLLDFLCQQWTGI